MPRTRTITETDVFVLSSEDLDEVEEQHICMAAGCGYAPRPYLPSNTRMDLWSALALITDRDPASLPHDDEGRLIVSAEDVSVVALCGNWVDDGGYPQEIPAGTYGGNGCLQRFEETRKVNTVPFEYPLDD